MKLSSNALLISSTPMRARTILSARLKLARYIFSLWTWVQLTCSKMRPSSALCKRLMSPSTLLLPVDRYLLVQVRVTAPLAAPAFAAQVNALKFVARSMELVPLAHRHHHRRRKRNKACKTNSVCMVLSCWS